MSQKPDGGPAFPVGRAMDMSVGGMLEPTGMTLRDYFAAVALQGNMSSFAGCDCRQPTPEQFAQDAYQQADAMIEQRLK